MRTDFLLLILTFLRDCNSPEFPEKQKDLSDTVAKFQNLFKGFVKMFDTQVSEWRMEIY